MLQTISNSSSSNIASSMQVHFHGHDFKSFHKHVSAEILPEFLGGVLPNDDYADAGLVTRLLGRDAYYEGTKAPNLFSLDCEN